MAKIPRATLRQFLNKECLWVQDKASTNYTKIYKATTALSPNLKLPNADANGQEARCLNVTVILLKPKSSAAYATVYINDKLIDCCVPEVVFMKKIPGQWNLCLIYFGELRSPPLATAVPCNITLANEGEAPALKQADVWTTAEPINTDEELAPLAPRAAILGNYGAWISNSAILQLFVSMDMILCCPASLPTFPSLTHIVNLLTRCHNQECTMCYGGGVHVNAISGHTKSDDPGTSASCPCVTSCSIKRGEILPVTGNHNLLGLLFDPAHQVDVTALKVLSTEPSTRVSKLFCGLTDGGEEVPCTDANWQLLRHSALVTRILIYNCQTLKRKCLRSC
ncbi:tegument protein UL16 [Common bottlenose dolphin gammaherpesvirus 1 strain Sarasota]|uniref:Tegument protein UL16 n=1 Tax=Common bottlenose dolphin gammaherpesvirus 1 strain Sarasota TaxID=2022783 RepID=A0A1Z1NE20_9GAMA|nr:tegument protein UL16 [Common bottlenose dolphin gammaherpesvirus 1 strain Sarasota]ARW78096.1 tegument protein UL16 [Common bottlenose dolphin gammaherpesvirus 1 strain Sarasota]